MDPQFYTLKDFLKDPSFRNWVFNGSENDLLFWEHWLENHPEKKKIVNDAYAILIGIETREVTLSDKVIDNYWNELKEEISGRGALKSNNGGGKVEKPHNYSFFKFAAGITGILMIAGIFAYFLIGSVNESPLTYKTKYGEINKITLPDGSEVTLNGNSSLIYKRINKAKNNFNGGSIEGESAIRREVWLKGEAFFEVNEMSNEASGAKSKFIVHTNGLNVEVLGTKFSVNHRHKNTMVVLNHGKVQLKPKSKQEEGVILKPGELAKWEGKNQKIIKEKVNPEIYTSWRNNKLTFNEKTLVDVARLLQDNYGFKVSFEEASLKSKKFTGTIPADQINLLFTAISESFEGMEVNQDGQKVRIYKSN